MNSMPKLITLICTLLLSGLIPLINSTPPEDPIKCYPSGQTTNCTITNSYGMFPDRATCKAASVAYPTTRASLISVIANATKSNLKMKVATRYSHSIPKLVCPDGENGILISTKYLNRVISVDAELMTIKVESGVSLRELINEAARFGLALPYTPYWWGLTVGGLLGTGAHGSSLWGNGSSVHEHVVDITIVSPGTAEDGYVKVRKVDASNTREFSAVKVSLGVLGVISQVTFKLESMFKRSITYVVQNDTDLGQQATTFGSQHEFADISWYPSQRKAVYRIDGRTSSNSSNQNGLFDFIPFRSTLSVVLAANRLTEEYQESLKDANGKCIMRRLTTSTLLSSAFGLTNDGTLFTGYPVIGSHNRLQASGTCLDSLNDGLITACPWDSRIKGEYFHQTTFSIALSKVKPFIQDVQRLVNLDVQSLCVVEQYNGILIRYVKKTSAYLGKQEDSLDFDITYYRSKDPLKPRLYEDVLEEIEQMALFKYGGSPHWGKNRNLAFEGVISKYNKSDEFLKVKEIYDPQGLFSSKWTDQMLGLREGVSIIKEGCALEGLCICKEDIHCAPDKGYFCRAGKVYTDARVCRLITTSDGLHAEI